MASPQVKNGYFLVSIEFFEELCKAHINRESRQMLDVIIRQTWGYHRKTAEIPTLLFEKLTGLGRQAIHKARKKLLDINIITITQKGNSQVKTYCIQKDYEIWKVLPKKVTVRPQKGNSPLPKKVTVPAETYSNGNSSQVPKDNFKDNFKDNIKDILEGKRIAITQKGNSKKNNNQKGNIKDSPNPEIKIFIDFAFIEYKEKFNNPLLIDGGKDGDIIKKLLGTFSLEKLKELWLKFLNSDDDFVLNVGYSIGIFKTQINKLVSGGKSNYMTREEFCRVDDEDEEQQNE